MTAQKTTATSTLKIEADQPAQIVKPEPLKTLLVWSAPDRVFKRREREYFTTIGAFVFLTIVILLFLQEWLLIGVLIALSFYLYVMATIEPQKTEHKITNRGVITAGRIYRWDELGRFWFSEKWGQRIVHLETPFSFQRRLTMLMGETGNEDASKLLSQYLLQEEPEKTWSDKASDWLTKHIPLENADKR